MQQFSCTPDVTQNATADFPTLCWMTSRSSSANSQKFIPVQPVCSFINARSVQMNMERH